MPNLTRTPPSPPHARPVVRSAPSPAASKTKILLVRQPVKSVRKSDEPDRTVLRLMIGVIVAVGVIAATWLMGYLGFRLGFADLVRVRDLQIDFGGGLVTGTMMIIGVPHVVLQAGIEQPVFLMLGFMMIAIPAASLGAIKPTPPPGGPKPKREIVVLSITGAIFSVINALALIAWTVSPYRGSMVQEMPYAMADAQAWQANLQTVAGLDVLGTVAAALWVVVAMRLSIPLWMRGFAASACFFGLVVISVAMSMTNATVAQMTADRSVFFLDDGSLDPQLLIGYTPQSSATLSVRESRCHVELRDRPEVLEVIGKQSIVEFLHERAPKPQ